MINLAPQIEAWLFAQQGWVSSSDLCARFGIEDDRILRSIGDVPGLVSDFAISHTRKGFRHVRHATTLEWLAFKFSLMRHAISVIRRVKRLASKRHNVFLPTVPPSEKDSGQYLLLP